MVAVAARGRLKATGRVNRPPADQCSAVATGFLAPPHSPLPCGTPYCMGEGAMWTRLSKEVLVAETGGDAFVGAIEPATEPLSPSVAPCCAP